MSATELDDIDRAISFILRHAPQPERLRFSTSPSRTVTVTRLADADLGKHLAICRYLTDPECIPPERITREQRTRLYDYAHILRNERDRRRRAA